MIPAAPGYKREWCHWPDMPTSSSETRSIPLSFLPSNNLEDPPRRSTRDPWDRVDESLNSLVPAESNIPYDIKDVIHTVVDENYFFEVQEHYAKNLVIGFARLDGRSVGIVANQPAYLAGCLAIARSVKGARFVRF